MSWILYLSPQANFLRPWSYIIFVAAMIDIIKIVCENEKFKEKMTKEEAPMIYLSPLGISRQQYHQNLPFNAHFEALFTQNNSAIKMNHLQNLLPSKFKITSNLLKPSRTSQSCSISCNKRKFTHQSI